MDYNIRKQWIDFVKRSYCGAFKITTNTRLCSVHFTPDGYSNYHRVKSGFLKSPLMLVSGAEPTFSVPGLHPPVPQTAGATITATGNMCLPSALPIAPTVGATITTAGIMYPPPTLSVGLTAGAFIAATGIMCWPPALSVAPIAEMLRSVWITIGGELANHGCGFYASSTVWMGLLTSLDPMNLTCKCALQKRCAAATLIFYQTHRKEDINLINN